MRSEAAGAQGRSFQCAAASRVALLMSFTAPPGGRKR